MRINFSAPVSGQISLVPLSQGGGLWAFDVRDCPPHISR